MAVVINVIHFALLTETSLSTGRGTGSDQEEMHDEATGKDAT